jgi:hypothetical protein
MKIFVFALALVLSIVSICMLVFIQYDYSVKCGQYLGLADDASTSSSKLVYLTQYRNKVEGISQESAVYFFPKERMTKTTQLNILDTLIIRLEKTSQMDEKSLEYQQAMYQISGQEMDHTLSEINNVFHGCWDLQHNKALWVFIMWLSIFVWIWWIILINEY